MQMHKNEELIFLPSGDPPLIGMFSLLSITPAPEAANTNMLWPLMLQVLLIVLNAFFAMSEIAVISVREGKVKRMAEEGDKRAKSLERLIAVPARFLSTIQIGITLAGFLGSAFAADRFAQPLSDQLAKIGLMVPSTVSVVLITLILSYFTLIFGELVPKRLAMQNSEKIALGVAGVLSLIATLFRPIVWLLTASTNGVLRLLRVDPSASEEQASEEEIRLMVSLGEESGTIEHEEKQLIENVFEFNNKTAEEVMVHRTDMVAFSIEDTHEEILQTIEESGLSRFPVYEEDVDNIVGVLRARDYFVSRLGNTPKPLQQLLLPPFFVPETVRTDMLLRGMQKRNAHMAIVLDEYGGTSGLVTMEDLLEELVGNIYDEGDEHDPSMEEVEPGVWRMPGFTEVDELAELFDMDFEEEDVDTLGGLVFKALDEIPEDGTTPQVQIHGLNIRVEQIEDRRVEWALVSLCQPQELAAVKGE